MIQESRQTLLCIILLGVGMLNTSWAFAQKANSKNIYAPKTEVVEFADTARLLEKSIEFGFTLGGLGYVGDVAPTSLEIVRETKPVGGVFIRKHILPVMAIRSGLTYGQISGRDDNFEKPAWRRERDFSFTSQVVSLSLIGEWDIFGKRRFRKKDSIVYELDSYKQIAVVNKLRHSLSPYVFAGGNGVMTSPKAFYNIPFMESKGRLDDVEHDQKNGGTKTRIGLVFGGGVNLDMGRKWILGAEFGFNTAFTDYFDGISHAARASENDWLVFGALNLSFRLGKKDSDGDGTPDHLDKCPKIPGMGRTQGCPDADNDLINDKDDECPRLAGVVELAGCPIKDADHDSVPDVDDLCPDVFGKVKFKGCPDRDNDDVEDKEDQCPDVAGVVKFKGCPDADKDDVDDREDLCPKVAGKVAFKGCPDTDDDGIEDKVDECPTEKGEWEYYHGCPPRDTDRDSIEDKYDPCPLVPGPLVYKGCPDTDKDKIPDNLDYCPSTPGTADNNGCPVIEKKDREKLKIAVEAVKFQTGKALLKPESSKILAEIANIMKKYPDYHLNIDGHTDDVGEEANNQALSEKRADACLQFLVEKGIVAERLHAKGYGESRPIADNKTNAGRTINRRVEFNLYIPERKK